MVFRRHFVALVPVCLPPTTDGEARRVGHLDVLFFTDCVRGRDVSDIVMEIEVLNVPRELGTDSSHAVSCLVALSKVDPAELAIEQSSNILNREVLVNTDKAPVRDVHCLRCFLEDELWVGHAKLQGDEVKLERSCIHHWTVLDASHVVLRVRQLSVMHHVILLVMVDCLLLDDTVGAEQEARV